MALKMRRKLKHQNNYFCFKLKKKPRTTSIKPQDQKISRVLPDKLLAKEACREPLNISQPL